MDALPADMDEIMRAVEMLQRGDRDIARNELLRLWRRWQERGSPLQRCTIAHFMADTEEDVAAELAWDLLALEAATGNRGEQDQDALDSSLANFLPSLHLNVGDAYRRLGDKDRASRHAANGLSRVGSLSDGGYADMVRLGLNRLRTRLSEGG
jgi:hypothetical protein